MGSPGPPSFMFFELTCDADSRIYSGAGGLSNAIPEVVKDAGFGGKFELRQVKTADNSMSPLEIWCNEAQERYVLLVNERALGRFANICQRERCGFSDVGKVVAKDEHGVAKLVLTDREPTVEPYVPPIDLPMEVLFPPGRTITRSVEIAKKSLRPFDASTSLKGKYGISALSDMITQATQLVFSLPAVGSKVNSKALLPCNLLLCEPVGDLYNQTFIQQATADLGFYQMFLISIGDR